MDWVGIAIGAGFAICGLGLYQILIRREAAANGRKTREP